MKLRIAALLAVVTLAAAPVAFGCEYSAMDDGVAAAPANASKVPVASACEGNGCAVPTDKLRAASKPAGKNVVAAVKNSSAPASAPTTR